VLILALGAGAFGGEDQGGLEESQALVEPAPDGDSEVSEELASADGAETAVAVASPEPAVAVVRQGPPAAEGHDAGLGEYRIQAGDQLHLSVWGEPGLTTDTVVMTHGRVPFPLLGEIVVANMTVSDLSEQVRQGYLRYYRDPRISLTVTPVVWPRVYVQGNVQRPGPVEYSPGRRLLDYVGMAGGFGADADLTSIGIVTHQSATAAKTTVDLSAVSADGQSTPNPVLGPGDTLWVAKALPVSVLGAVNKPGSVDYQHGLRLSDYVGMAGGPTNRAELLNASVKHTGPDGASSVTEVDLKAALEQPDDPELNPILAPGDTVTVPERFIGGTLEWSDILRALVAVAVW
jgi:polysaccharide export outer membrane protein